MIGKMFLHLSIGLLFIIVVIGMKDVLEKTVVPMWVWFVTPLVVGAIILGIRQLKKLD